VGTQTVTVHTPLQSSNVTGRLTYAAPTISDVTTLSGRPIEGGFAVTVQGAVRGVFPLSCTNVLAGRPCVAAVLQWPRVCLFLSRSAQNFFPGATSATIGDTPCDDVVVTDSVGLGVLRCTAPSGPGIGDVRLQVTVAGGGNASVPFLYAAPAVTRLSVVACAADGNVVIQVHGTNLGLRNSLTSPDPVVYIGDSVCFQPLLHNSTAVQCTALASPVGAYPVTGVYACGCSAVTGSGCLVPAVVGGLWC
jgi:hypothetical protein